MKTTTVENVPCWAGCYFAGCGGTSNFTQDDWRAVHGFEVKLDQDGLRLIAPIEGTYNEFTKHPAFGLPCSTEDWTAEVLSG